MSAFSENGVIDAHDLSGAAANLLLKDATIQGIRAGHRVSLEAFVRVVETIGQRPVIDRIYAFDQLPAALDHLDRGPSANS